MARLKMHRRQCPAVTIHSCRVSETVTYTDQDESAFSAADFQSRFQNLLECRVGSEEFFPLVLKIENAGDLFQVRRSGWENDAQPHQRPLENLCGIGLVELRQFGFTNEKVKLDTILAQSDLVAVFEDMMIHLLVVDEGTVGAGEVLQEKTLRHLHNFRVMPGNVLVVQDNVGIALSPDQYFTGVDLKNVLLPVWPNPI